MTDQVIKCDGCSTATEDNCLSCLKGCCVGCMSMKDTYFCNKCDPNKGNVTNVICNGDQYDLLMYKGYADAQIARCDDGPAKDHWKRLLRSVKAQMI